MNAGAAARATGASKPQCTISRRPERIHEAPLARLVKALQDAGAKVRGCDPEAMEQARPLLPGMSLADDAYGRIAGADALATATEWDEFRALDRARVKSLFRSPILIDLRDIYPEDEATRYGLSYTSVGRGGPT